MKTKKISWQAIAIVVLALVLIASIALGVSGAWFQDKDAVEQSAKMGEAVTIRLAGENADDAVETWSGNYKNTNPYPGDTIMGKTQIIMGTETPSVVRGKINVTVLDKNGTDITDTLPAAKTDMTSVTKPVQPSKSDYYEVTDGKSNFKKTEYETAVAAYKTAVVAYDKQLLANMLAVTLEGNANWESAAGSSSGYYYYTSLADKNSSIVLFDALVLNKELSNEIATWTITVTVEVEAIQAANLSEHDTWYSDLGTTIKGLVDNYRTSREVSGS